MLPQEFRLKSNRDIEKVFKSGKTVRSSFLFLKFAPNSSGSQQSKIAFSIGLRYSKKAVKRNRAKRVLREAAKNFLKDIKPGYNLVFFLDKNFSQDLNLEEANVQMNKTLSAAGLLESNHRH